MFIAIEGPDGSGKTTQAKLLSSWLDSVQIENVLTKEPGTLLSKECQQIRKMLLDPSNQLDSRAELFLYLADRAQHCSSCIAPAIDSGKWVISDRYSFSTIAYQGFGRGNKNLGSGDWFFETLGVASRFILPNVSFILDIPVEIGVERARRTNKEFAGGDRMEREGLEFHQRVRDGFLWVAKKYPGICVVMDARKTIEELHEDIKSVLKIKK